MIPFLDLKAASAELEADIAQAISRVVSSGWYIGGPEVETFEAEWAAYCEARLAVGIGNGLDALCLALRACDVGPGDEVIVPSHTFVATWLAVLAIGATPVPVEPNPGTMNISADQIAARLTSLTRAILPVHLYGQPVDLDPIIAIARANGLRVIEDAAQAHGARYNGRRIGGHGDVACWSFYPGKNLGALGDAGAITTNDPDIAARVRRLANYGSSTKYVHEDRGVNSRLDPLQAAVLSVKLKHLDAWNKRRSSIAKSYEIVLRGLGFQLPAVANFADPVWHLYVIQAENREPVQAALDAAGIGTLVHYPIACHQQKAMADLDLHGTSLPLAEKLASTVLSLPIGPHCPPDIANRVLGALSTALKHP